MDRFHGSSNQELIQHLKKSGVIMSDRVFNIMCSVDRKYFTTDSSKAYMDTALMVAHGKTISAPHMHARILELFADKLQTGNRALDIGFGSGYLTTCMALMLGEIGLVVGIECIPQFRDLATKIIVNHHRLLLENKCIELVVGDGRLGYSSKGPYDIIYVGAAAAEVPSTLINQLAVGGRLIMPVGERDESQKLVQIDKMFDGRIKRKAIMNVIYGHLTDVKENEMHKDNETSNKIIRDASKFKTEIEKILHQMNKVEEDAKKEHVRTNEQVQQWDKRISDMEKNIKIMGSKTNDSIEQVMSQRDTNIEEQIESVDKKIESTIKNVNLELITIENKLIGTINKKADEQDNTLKKFDRVTQQSSELGSKLAAIEQKLANLEIIVEKVTLEKTVQETAMLLPAHMFEVIENAMKIQKNMLEVKNRELEEKDTKLQTMQQKLESLEENLKIFTSECKKAEEKKELLDKELEKKNKQCESVQHRLEIMEKEIKVLQSKIETQPSIVKLIDKVLEIQHTTLEENNIENSLVKRNMDYNAKWEEMQIKIANVEKEAKAIESKMKEKLETTTNQCKKMDVRNNKEYDELDIRVRSIEKELELVRSMQSNIIKENVYVRRGTILDGLGNNTSVNVDAWNPTIFLDEK